MNLLITGGTGSLGSQLVRHFLSTGAEKVIVYSRDEVKQGDLAREIQDARLRCFLGDVRDPLRLVDALWGVDVVVHTAALKRVDQVSYNPSEVLATNVLGTQNVLWAAKEQRVPRVLFISSDKAVHATNVYGKSKAFAEDLVVRYNALSWPRGTVCSVLRYGNVWGSRGSVMRAFKEQAARGVSLTVTDPAMTRFLITLPQAASLIARCLDIMEGGEIFVPKLPAWTLLQLANLVSAKQQVSGVRPGGEKLHEQLLSTEEEGRTVEYGTLYVVKPAPHEWTTVTRWDGFPASTVRDYTSQWADPVPESTLVELLNAL